MNIAPILEKIYPIILEAEKLYREGKLSDGLAKKAFVVSAVNALVDVPYVPESVEAIAIGYVVDGVVWTINKIKGKVWEE